METIKKFTRLNIKFSVMGSLFVGMIFFVGCGTPQTTAEPENFEEIKELVDAKEFDIQFQWAQPQGGSMVDLLSNPNHIRFEGEKVDIFLPYFGVRHSGGAYSRDSGGIKVEGLVTNLKISEDQGKNNILLQFEGRQGSEILMFNVTIYENGKAFANVSSSERANISYQGGDVKPTPQVAER